MLPQTAVLYHIAYVQWNITRNRVTRQRLPEWVGIWLPFPRDVCLPYLHCHPESAEPVWFLMLLLWPCCLCSLSFHWLQRISCCFPLYLYIISISSLPVLLCAICFSVKKKFCCFFCSFSCCFSCIISFTSVQGVAF